MDTLSNEMSACLEDLMSLLGNMQKHEQELSEQNAALSSALEELCSEKAAEKQNTEIKEFTARVVKDNAEIYNSLLLIRNYALRILSGQVEFDPNLLLRMTVDRFRLSERTTQEIVINPS